MWKRKKAPAQVALTKDDLLVVMQTAENLRLIMGSLVSGLVADGFTEEQARDIVAGSLRHR